jgi:hypothetical protein
LGASTVTTDTADASTVIAWGDGEHRCRLAIKQLRELEDKRNAGTGEIYRRIALGIWRADDLFEVIRLGLIGGGMEPQRALALVTRYFNELPLAENALAANAILGIAVLGRQDDQPGKAPPDPEAAERIGSVSAISTAPVAH